MTIRPVAGLPLLHMDHPEFTGPPQVIKSVFDRLMAAVALILASPLLLAIVIAIRLGDGGPALFRQERVGKDGRPFVLFKFRTMVVDADQQKNLLIKLNETDGVLFKIRRDPRVTPIGAKLRRWSLDELPQLINVLIGNMSLVGPRPALPEEAALYGHHVRRRLMVKPGITGLWQVKGRSDLTWDEAVRLDLRYVENWSFMLDLQILWKTSSAVARGKGAYLSGQGGDLLSFTDVDLARLLVALAVLLIAAHGCGSLFARLGQPPAIGEILGGILLGPTLLAAVAPGVAHWIFPKDGASAAALGAVYQLGLLLLMFAAGTEMRKLLQRSNVRTVSLIAGFGMVLPFAAGLGLVAALGVKNFIGPAGNHTALILVFGMAVAVTSIPVISRIMHDLHLLPTRFARMVLSAAVVEDIVLYVVLAVAVGLVQPKGKSAFGLPGALNIHTVSQNSVYHTIIAVVFLAIALGFGGRAYRTLSGLRINVLARRSPVAFQLLWMLALSAAALAIGLVPLYGAFTAGIAVAVADESLAGQEDRNALTGISFGFFIPIYFAIIGIQLDLIHHFDPLFFLGFLAFACIAKAASVYLGARLAKENRFMAWSLAVAMNARGGPGIVLASTAYAAGIINQTFFVKVCCCGARRSRQSQTTPRRKATRRRRPSARARAGCFSPRCRLVF